MAVDENTRNLIVAMEMGGSSRREIARELGVSRNTVRRVLNAVAKERRRGQSALPSPTVRRESKLDQYEGFIKETLDEFPDLTAVRLQEKLEKKGFDGGYTIVKERLRLLRPKALHRSPRMIGMCSSKVID